MNTKEFCFIAGLNKKGNEYLEVYDLYHSLENKESVSALALKNYVYNFKRGILLSSLIHSTRDEFISLLKKQKTLLKNTSDMYDEAFKYVQDYLKSPKIKAIMVEDKKKKTIIVRKMVGLRATDVQKIFGVTETESHVLFQNGFVSTFVNTYVSKKVYEEVENLKTYPNIYSTVSEGHKVDNRFLFNIDVDFCINVEDVSKCTCENIKTLISRFVDPIEKL